MTYGMLDINFEGYFMCRLATDPDPTNEERGMSGYTMAFANEDPLDQVIRLQATADWLKRRMSSCAIRMCSSSSQAE